MVRAAELFKSYRANPHQTVQDLREALDRGRDGKPGGVKPDEFSIRDLAAWAICDRHGEPIGLPVLESFCKGELILEADAGLSMSAFASITRQVIVSATLEGYDVPAFVLSKMIPVITGRQEQTKLAGVSLPQKDGKSLEVPELGEFPLLGMSDEYVKTPAAKKRGGIVAISKEAVLADDTGKILDQARQVGQITALQKELLITDYVIGAVSNCVVEKRVGDSGEVTKNLFYTSTDSERWTNAHVNALADWSDIDTAENLFLANTLPGTGQPPTLIDRLVLVPPQLRSTASRILNATETRSGSGNVVVAGNPVASLGLQMAASPYVYSQLVAAGVAASDAAGTWFYGDLKQSFRYYQRFGLKVEEDRTGEAAFTHDILVRFKASECGTPVVVEPRVWAKNNPS